MYERTCSFVLTFIQILIFVNANGRTVTVQPQLDYSETATLHKNSEPATFKVGTVGLPYNEKKAFDISPFQLPIADFGPEKGSRFLPELIIDIETAKNVAYGDPLKITVRSYHHNGKPVKGQALIKLNNPFYGSPDKIIDVDGIGHVEFDLRKDVDIDFRSRNRLRHGTINMAELLIHVLMKEDYTGNKQYKYALINVHRSRYTINVPNNVTEYYAKKSFELKAFVKNLDGSPVRDSKQMAELLISKTHDRDAHVFTSELDKNGMALFKVTLPTADYYPDVVVMYADQVINIPSLTGLVENDGVEKPENFYSIVAPATLQSQLGYSVFVTLHENSVPATIKVGIVGPSYNDTKTIDVSPSQTEVVNFEVPKLKNGDYKLEAEGIKGLIFKNSTDLIFKNKEPKAYIQTDKDIYEPGDVVQYGIVVLDEDTRPAKVEKPLKLVFKDGAGNFFKQINDINLTKGVYRGEFQLSEQPISGDWTMEFTLGPNEDDTKTEKKFKVAKNALQKFSVDIEMAKDVAFDDPLKITVHSHYPNGKPVKGQALIRVTINGAVSEKVIDVDGTGQVEFDWRKDLHVIIYDDIYFSIPFNVLVVMTEKYTGNKQSKTVSANLHP